MRLRDHTRDLERDPLLKVGAWAMVIALGFAIVVAVGASLDQPMEVAAANAATSKPKPATEPLVRTDPGINPWVERDIPSPKPKVTTEAHATPSSAPPPAPVVDRQPASVPKPTTQPDPPKPPTHQPLSQQPLSQQPLSQQPPSQQPPSQQPLTQQQSATTSTAGNNPLQTVEQTNAANRASHYHLPPGAIMALTIPSLGLENAPVLDSASRGALDRGVVHLPDTSLPWSDTQERNVYLAGHRLGWPGTGSHLIFYRLNQLTGGEKVTLRGANGKRYDYRVLESFIVGPRASWVTGRVKGRDLLTLQTCTPIPTFEERLIVRAERI